MKTFYTAVGRFQRKGSIGNLSCPVIFVGQRECNVDMQEMLLWTVLSWRILDLQQIEKLYHSKAADVGYVTHRSWEACLNRLKQRGLVVSGTGESGEDALYNLLSCLYVVPVSSSTLLRMIIFFKSTLRGVKIKTASKVFVRPPMTDCERQVYLLSNQALLSTAEIIKCVEKKVVDLSTNELLLDALYGDEETTSDNIASLVRCMDSRQPVLLAVANLYLSQQIIFERGDVA
ncbi:hypothetical protein [Anaerotignum sp.]|uniref:hypothetical protein n=1 Tax=Anaerotignum sp. TaxID=2039241 RepID=UPI0028AF5AA5|nr:hypothetical protein [Anaerotignum sp.]